MKRISLLLAVLLTFAVTVIAQDASGASAGQSSTTTTSKSKKSMSASSDTSSSTPSDASTKSHASSKSASGKTSQLTGCISSSANSEGNYTLTNGRYKKGVELVPASGQDVSKHAGHEVQLTGNWTTEAAEGKGEAHEKNEKAEKGEKHFQVASIKHMSETCTAGTSAKSSSTKANDTSASNSTTPATSTKHKNKKAGNAMAAPSSTSATPK